MSENKILHRELCEIGARFLKRPASQNGHGCHFTLIEPAAYGENADVFGVRHGHEYIYHEGRAYPHGPHDTGTILLEAKTSRSDFLVDRKKPHRMKPETGVGKWRYFICPTGLIQVNELPEKWGLVYVNGRGHCEVVAGALAVPFKRDENIQYRTKYRNGDELRESFLKYAFNERNVQNEQNILTMALARLSNAEDLLYMQRNYSNMQMKCEKLRHENLLLERRLVNPTDEVLKALAKVGEEINEINKTSRENANATGKK